MFSYILQKIKLKSSYFIIKNEYSILIIIKKLLVCIHIKIYTHTHTLLHKDRCQTLQELADVLNVSLSNSERLTIVGTETKSIEAKMALIHQKT